MHEGEEVCSFQESTACEEVMSHLPAFGGRKRGKEEPTPKVAPSPFARVGEGTGARRGQSVPTSDGEKERALQGYPPDTKEKEAPQQEMFANVTDILLVGTNCLSFFFIFPDMMHPAKTREGQTRRGATHTRKILSSVARFPLT